MRYFPIFVDLQDQSVLLSGGGEIAAAKLRLLMKTPAKLVVFAENPDQQVQRWADGGKFELRHRRLLADDLQHARLVYAASGDELEDARVVSMCHDASVLINRVDSLDDSDFLTPAMVDRAPVTVAIGTEGTAPVLARKIKAQNEERLPVQLGVLASVARLFRERVLIELDAKVRRHFWQRYYEEIGPRALAVGGKSGVSDALENLLAESKDNKKPQGHVSIVGAGPGDPELLTLKARKALHDADVVVFDRLVSIEILELARREAELIEVGKTPGGRSWKQENINALVVQHAASGSSVVRLKGGDVTLFGRLDEEMDALDTAEIPFTIIPGITAASAAAASINVSLTRRGCNSSVQFLTGHDVDGFAEHDWRALSQPGATAAIYMGLRASPFIQLRLLNQGAESKTPMTVVENASRPEQKVVSTTLGGLRADIKAAGITGPAIVFLGLMPRETTRMLSEVEIRNAVAV